MTSYVTYDALIQCGILIVGIIGMVNQIKITKKINRPCLVSMDGLYNYSN